jgi:hypothetical protein
MAKGGQRSRFCSQPLREDLEMRPIAIVIVAVLGASVPLFVACEPSSSSSSSSSGGADAAPVNECPASTGPGTTYSGNNIATNTVWKAADGPFHVPTEFIIDETATLILEPCVRVIFDGSAGVNIRGNLVAEGTPTNPISFEAADPTKPWSGLLLGLDRAGSLSLANATLSDGGNVDNPNIWGLIDVRGPSDGPPVERLKVKNVTVKGSQAYGVVLRDTVAFTADSTNLTISGAKTAPMRIEPNLASTIPTGSYTGNTNDEIVLGTGFNMTYDATLHARGVPYKLGDAYGGPTLSVGDTGKVATLTIEAGVTVKAQKDGRIYLRSASETSAQGRLVVKGTADQPVVFTSSLASPQAGDWAGIRFSAPDPVNSIDHARVEYAGGPSQAKSFHCDPQSSNGGYSASEDAAIALYGQPSSVFITNTSILASAGDGIGRSWSGDPIDFLPTNTFTQVAACKQSFPRDVNGRCPNGGVPCP